MRTLDTTVYLDLSLLWLFLCLSDDGLTDREPGCGHHHPLLQGPKCEEQLPDAEPRPVRSTFRWEMRSSLSVNSGPGYSLSQIYQHPSPNEYELQLLLTFAFYWMTSSSSDNFLLIFSICKKVFMKLLKTYFHFSWPGLPRHPDPGAVPRVAPGPPALSLHPASFYPNSDNILINILSLSDCAPEVCSCCQMYTIYIQM